MIADNYYDDLTIETYQRTIATDNAQDCQHRCKWSYLHNLFDLEESEWHRVLSIPGWYSELQMRGCPRDTAHSRYPMRRSLLWPLCQVQWFGRMGWSSPYQPAERKQRWIKILNRIFTTCSQQLVGQVLIFLGIAHFQLSHDNSYNNK